MVNSKKRGPRAMSIKKKRRGSTKSTEVVYHSTKEIKVERALIENFIGLQKVMVNLSGKFDSLASQISKLLELFEISAKALVRKELSPSGEADSNKIMEKLDNLSQQAGLIGKGLALIHEVGTENEKQIIPLNLQKNNSQRPVSSVLATPNLAPGAKMTKELESFERS